jgi:myo-inositol-hexaphosphate 3-phosphohydrolase
VAISGQAVHVVWSDMRDGNSEIYYKRDPTGNPVGIQNISNEIPNGFSLEQNYPNPFNPVTNIIFSIPKSGMVKLVVYDIIGKQVSELVNGNYNAGSYKVDFNASVLSSGVYFYKIETNGFTDIKKMMLIK